MKKIAVRLDEEKINILNQYAKTINCSRNQIIENAIDFYIEQYHASQHKLLPVAIETILLSNITKLEQNISSFLFKNAVETAMLTQVLATIAEIDPEDLKLLREQATEIVKHSIGQLDLEGVMNQVKKGDG